jgi:predicted acyl esterase
MVYSKDGVKLATDVYLPSDFSDKIPALLIRTPYKKDDLKDIGKLYKSDLYNLWRNYF